MIVFLPLGLPPCSSSQEPCPDGSLALQLETSGFSVCPLAHGGFWPLMVPRGQAPGHSGPQGLGLAEFFNQR